MPFNAQIENIFCSFPVYTYFLTYLQKDLLIHNLYIFEQKYELK